MKRFTSAMTKHARAARAAAIGAALAAPLAFAQSGSGSSLDFTAAANQMKTDATSAVGGVGTIILGIVAALVVLGIVIKVFRKG